MGPEWSPHLDLNPDRITSMKCTQQTNKPLIHPSCPNQFIFRTGQKNIYVYYQCVKNINIMIYSCILFFWYTDRHNFLFYLSCFFLIYLLFFIFQFLFWICQTWTICICRNLSFPEDVWPICHVHFSKGESVKLKMWTPNPLHICMSLALPLFQLLRKEAIGCEICRNLF